MVLDDPIGPGPGTDAGEEEPEPAWMASAARVVVANEGEVPIGVTSHLHFFEANRRLRFDRAAAWGMRLALPARSKCFFLPGEPREVRLIPIGGGRVVRGHGDLVDGALDAPGAREAALELARRRGFAGA